MKNVMKRIGKFLVTLSPTVIAIGMNFLVSIIAMIICGVVLGMQMGVSGEINAITQEDMTNRLLDMVMEYAIPATIVFQLFNFLIFGLWFKLWGHNKFVNPLKVVKGSNLGVAFLAAVSLEMLIGVAMSVVAVFWPEVIQSFAELMEQSGVGEMNVLSFLATVILAPITEELIFRGVTMRLTKWAGMSFVVGNIVQAVLFGAFHMNWVQGVYATLIGLVLGYLGHRYKTLWVPMLVHLFCNLYATVIGMFEIPDTILVNVIMFILGTVFAIGAILIMKKENSKVAVAESAASMEQNSVELN